MKKFEEEFNYLIGLSGKVLIGQIDAKEFEKHRANFINEYGKKQQPEIQEVPQFVADWYEENKGALEYSIWDYIRDWEEQEEDDFYNFMDNNQLNPIETILAMKNGYTVAKEKRFHLALPTKFFVNFKKTMYVKDDPEQAFTLHKHSAKQFTQSEIVSMAADSYEQIEVEE